MEKTTVVFEQDDQKIEIVFDYNPDTQDLGFDLNLLDGSEEDYQGKLIHSLAAKFIEAITNNQHS
jgi:hypothetical protein